MGRRKSSVMVYNRAGVLVPASEASRSKTIKRPTKPPLVSYGGLLMTGEQREKVKNILSSSHKVSLGPGRDAPTVDIQDYRYFTLKAAVVDGLRVIVLDVAHNSQDPRVTLAVILPTGKAKTSKAKIARVHPKDKPDSWSARRMRQVVFG